MFNKHKWYYNLTKNGDTRAEAAYSKIVQNNSVKRILKGHKQVIKGSDTLDGVAFNYTAYLGKADFTRLNLLGHYKVHPNKNWTLVVGNMGTTLKGEYFYLSNPRIGTAFPVLGVHFSDYNGAADWFDKYDTHFLNTD